MKRFQQSGNPRMPSNQTNFQLGIDLEIQSIRDAQSPARTNAESTTSLDGQPNPEPLTGD
jgi:hypothetical protein